MFRTWKIILLTCTVIITAYWTSVFQSFLIHPKPLLGISGTVSMFQMTYQSCASLSPFTIYSPAKWGDLKYCWLLNNTRVRGTDLIYVDLHSSNLCCSRVNCVSLWGSTWGSTWVIPLFTLLLCAVSIQSCLYTISLNSRLAFPKLLLPSSPPQRLLKIDIKKQTKNFCVFPDLFPFLSWLTT